MDNEENAAVPGVKSLQQVVGALLFGSDHPLQPEEIRNCLKNVAKDDQSGDETVKLFGKQSLNEIKEALDAMQKQLDSLNIGFRLVKSSAGYRFQTQSEAGRWVRNLLKMDRPARLSHPALETLAIVAYRQPIAKSEIEGIRGVDAGHILKALMELHLVRIVGRSDLPGRPFLYGTTTTFLDHFGLGTLKELNELDPTLQRSKPAERKALHTKKKEEKKDEPVEEPVLEQPVQETPRTEEVPPGPSARNDAALEEMLASDEEAETPDDLDDLVKMLQDDDAEDELDDEDDEDEEEEDEDDEDEI